MKRSSKANLPATTENSPHSATASEHELDKFLDGLARLAANHASRETFYRALVTGLPQAWDRSSCGVAFSIAGQIVPAYTSSAPDQLGGITADHLTRLMAGLDPNQKKSVGNISVARISSESHWHFISTAALDEQNRFAFWLSIALHDAEPATEILEDLVEEIARQIIEYEQRLLLQQHERRAAELRDLTSMVLGVTQGNNTQQTAYGIVNDLAQFTQADRVCLFDQGARPLACSGVSAFRASSRPIRLLRSLARSVIRKGTAIVHGQSINADQPAWIQSSLDAIRQEWNPVALYGIPLEAESRRWGALTIEYLEGEDIDWVDRQRRIETATHFLVPVYAKMRRLNRGPFLRPIAGLLDLLTSRPWRLIVPLLIVFAVFVAAYWGLMHRYSPLEIAATGTLVPQDFRSVFSPEQGSVGELSVAEGQRVTAGDLIVVIRSDYLQAEIAKAEGELEEALEQLRIFELADVSQITPGGEDSRPEIERARVASELKRQRIRVETVQEALGHLRSREEQLKIYAPASGIVTTRKVETSLPHRPVAAGDELMTIADTEGTWEVILEIDQRRAGYVLEALRASQTEGIPVRMRLSSAPTQVVCGQLRKLDFMARDSNLREASKMVRAYVDIDEAALRSQLRIGTQVDGRIQCGERNGWFILTHELRDKIREFFFF